MKAIVLLLVSLSLALQSPAVLAPGQGDAAAAVAAHNKDGPSGPQGGAQNGSTLFVITGSGSIVHAHGATPGLKPFKSKVKAGDVAPCIAGTAQGCDGSTIETDVLDPTAYLFFDSNTAWRVATNANGDNATDLVGSVDGKGGFMFAGTHVLSGTSFLLSGKVKFAKGTFTPLSIAGKFSAVSSTQGHYGTGTFKAQPAP